MFRAVRGETRLGQQPSIEERSDGLRPLNNTGFAVPIDQARAVVWSDRPEQQITLSYS